MATATQMRRLALGFPESEEKSHFGQPDFRVRNKIFAGLNPQGTRGVLKLGPELQAMLIDSHPTVFLPATGAWGRQGWTHVELAHVELAVLRDLLQEAWRMVAPKRLLGPGSVALVETRAPAKRMPGAKSASPGSGRSTAHKKRAASKKR